MAQGNMEDCALNWLTQRAEGQIGIGIPGGNMHVLWGGVPDDGQSDETSQQSRHTADSSSGAEGAQTTTRSQRGVKNLRCTPSSTGNRGFNQALSTVLTGAEHSQADSSEQLYVVEPESSQNSISRDGNMSVRGSHMDGHIVFGDDSRSDVSNEGRSVGASADDHAPANAPRGTWPSVGSQLHMGGNCKPCMFSHTAIGCSNGASCDFCHLGHRRHKATRPCKAKRERFRAIADRQAREAGLIPDSGAAGSESGAASAGEMPAGSDQPWPHMAEEPARHNAQGKRILKL